MGAGEAGGQCADEARESAHDGMGEAAAECPSGRTQASGG